MKPIDTKNELLNKKMTQPMIFSFLTNFNRLSLFSLKAKN